VSNHRFGERRPVNDLIPVHLQAAHDGAEGHFRPEGFHLRDLRGKRQAVGMARIHRGFTGRQTTDSAGGQEVGGVEREAVNHAEAAVPHHRHLVTRQVSLAQIRELQHRRSPSRDHDPTALLRDVLLVQRLTKTQQQVEDFDLTSGRRTRNQGERSARDAQIDDARDGAGSRAAIGSGSGMQDAGKNSRVDGDLQLLGSIVGPHGQVVEIALDVHHVVQDGIEILTLVDEQLDIRAGGTLQREGAVSQIVVDGDGGLRADLYAIALILDLAFVANTVDA
jgi:hypothetical protein